MLKKIFLLPFLLVSYAIFAQEIGVPMDSIYSRFLRQIQSFPMEKIYVHTDKSDYFSGETVWFRAYLADYLTHSPAYTASRYVYGELYNPVDSLIQRIKIRADSAGVFKGYFNLSPYLAGGNYRLRFYTRYMEEADEEYFFNRVISVHHPLSTLYHTDASFTFMENGSRLRATLRFTQVKDGSAFTPKLLTVIHPSGKENAVAVNNQGEAGFDLLPERDLRKNLLHIQCLFNDMVYEQYLAVPPSRNEYHVSFFPEGGALPDGARVRVAFKALHAGGLSEQVTGKIYSTTGDTVAVFQSNPLGMGSFTFVPKKGEKYAALCRNSFGVEKRFDLPEVSERSINLKISQNADRFRIQVIHSGGMVLSDSMRLLIQCRGVPYYNELWAVGEPVVFRKELFPSGVLQLLLLDDDLNPVSERLVFNLNEQELAQVNISTDKDNYRRREPIRAQIRLSAFDSIPLQGGFSVSVTADHQVKPDSTVNILSTLLLSSELKGYIESPAWYFTKENMGEIDALLLTQGWSRYDIAAVLKGDVRTPEKTPEVAPEITGSIESGMFLQNKGEDWLVTMSVASGSQVNRDATSAAIIDGRFRLPYNERPNGTTYILQLIAPPKTFFRADMQLDTIIYPSADIRLPYRFDMGRSDFETYKKTAVQPYTPNDDLWTLYLSEVVVSATKAKGIHSLSPGRIQDRKITLSELKTIGKRATTLENVLRLQPDVFVEPMPGRGNKDLVIMYRYGKAANTYWPYQIVIDGIWYFFDLGYESGDMNAMLNIPVEWLEEIEIVRAPAPIIRLEGFMGMEVNFNWDKPQHPGHFGVLLITTKSRTGGRITRIDKMTVSPLGYQENREFYSPAYETAEQLNETTSDLRSTIYWNPDVRANEDGEAEITFYAADTETDYTVTIEGITKDGVLIRKTEKIKRDKQ